MIAAIDARKPRGGGREAWPLLLGIAATVFVAGGCSSSLREVRARSPKFRFPGVAASGQFEVARCIRDVLEAGVGELSILQEIEQDPDGMHVIGRPDESQSAAVFDVAIREDAVVAMMAPAPVIPRDTLRDAITLCVGAKGEQSR
jgi:hypothetical protein